MLTALSLPALQGCSLARFAPSERTIDQPPANLAADCVSPAPLPDRAILVAELVQGYVDLASAFVDCALRHNGLKAWAEGVTAKKPPR